MPGDIDALRADLERRGLSEADIGDDPIAALRLWRQTARDAGINDAGSMVLATATPDGIPSARAVVLRILDERGLTFFTDDCSPKARDLAENPRAEAVIVWVPLQRQARISGVVERVPEDEAAANWSGRDRAAQIAAVATPQSAEVTDRAYLEARVAAVESELAGRDVPAPGSWAGYRLVPDAVEFWQGRPGRLHDRLRYRRRRNGPWQLVRLAP